MPPPSFAPAKAAVAPPPFAEEPSGEVEEEVVREVVVRKLIDDGVPVEDREVGKIQLGPYVALAATVVLAGVFGTVCGSQIDRAVRANRAIESADRIHSALLEDQNALKNLKSRISGAARKAIHKTEPGADFELLDYLGAISKERPFSARAWSGEFYQAFKAAPLLFEYYRGMGNLWDMVHDVAKRQNDPATRAALSEWPQERENITKLNAEDGSSGYGVAFRRREGKVLAVLGVFRNSRRERVGRDDQWRSDFIPLGEQESRTLSEYQPGYDPLSDEPESWFVRANPDVILGQRRDLTSYGGPFVSAAQDPYLRYLMDVNMLSKGLSTVQSTQDNLIQALSDIRQERRVFTFGF